MKLEDPELNDLLLNKSDKLCRICLTEAGEESSSIFGDPVALSEKIMLCARVKVRPEDGLPSAICTRCFGELDAADRFRIKCEYSDSLLRKFFESDSVGKTVFTELTNVPLSTVKEEPDEFKEEIKETDIELELKLSQDKECKLDDLISFDNASGAESNHSFSDREVLAAIADRRSKKRKKTIKSKRKKNADKVISDVLNLSAYVPDLKIKIKSEPTDTCCHICNKLLKSKKHLSKHMETSHPVDRPRETGEGAQRRYHCTECTYCSPRRQTLLYHMRIHTGEKPYLCTVCDRRFAQPSSLSSHLKSHSDKMYFTCPQCGKQFKHKEKYERHKGVHSDIKKFVCEICNKGLKSQDTLKSHMNRHYNIRNFSCETCGAAFVTRIELLNHSKKHSDEKKFQCTICEFRTRLKQILEKHMKRHTGERSFKCEHCTYSCYERGELKFHMRKHTREKRYSCPVCQRLFIHSSSVNKHMLRIHGLNYKVNDSVDRRVVK